MPEICAIYLPQQAPSGFTLFASSAGPAPVDNFRQSYNGGPILLLEGSTGKNRLCNDYDEPGQKCRVWAYSHHPKKKTAPVPSPVSKPTPETDEGKS
jgi:hypothetical protein